VAPVITLTTDFGLHDPYVAAMKGVILSLNPDARIVDISHGVRPQQVEQGAFILGSACGYFPPGAVHVAVVDPGVGTGRLPIVLSAPGAVFVGPDNGLLSAALPEATRALAAGGPARVPLPEGLAAHVLAEPRFQRHPVSDTFHGRDIFAPAAAHLSLGVRAEEFGPELREVVAVPPFRGELQPDGSLAGRVLHIDRFGNLVTTVRGDQVEGRRVTVEVCGRRIEGVTRTYGAGEGLMAVTGSAGLLEVAVRNGDAAGALGAEIGAPVRVTFA